MAKLNIVIEKLDETLPVKKLREGYARLTRGALVAEKRAAIEAGCYLTLGQSTFTQAETEDWKLWATSVTGKSYKTVESYLAVAKAYDGSPSAIQTAVSDWTFEALQAFASVPKEDRKAVVEMVKAEDSNPSPQVVRAARDIVKDEALTDKERADKAAAKKKRDKENAASKTIETADALKPLVKSIKTDDDWKAFIVGVMVGRSYHGTDEKTLEDAIKQIRQQREAGAAAVQAAAANLVKKA